MVLNVAGLEEVADEDVFKSIKRDVLSATGEISSVPFMPQDAQHKSITKSPIIKNTRLPIRLFMARTLCYSFSITAATFPSAS